MYDTVTVELASPRETKFCRLFCETMLISGLVEASLFVYGVGHTHTVPSEAFVVVTSVVLISSRRENERIYSEVV